MKLFHMCDEEAWIGPDLETTKAAAAQAWGADTVHDFEDAREYTEAELDSTLVVISDDIEGEEIVAITARQLLANEIAEGGEFPRFAFGVDY